MAKWVLNAKKADFNELADRLGLDPVTVRIMRNRDLLNYEEMYSFLNGREEDMHSPHLLNDIDKAVDIILDAIANDKKIRVIGDYDVDGVTSTFILVKGIRTAGGKVDYAIPNRVTDGYGINENLIDQAANDGIELIVTCDNGIAARDALRTATERGIVCIVTDHHEVPYIEENGELNYIYPEVEAIVNPKRHDSTYPFPGICGAMVAYKLILALSEKRILSKEIRNELREMAGLGTVCDVMELKDENRILVKLALKDMNESHNMGLRALRRVCELDKKEANAYQLGFVIGPCINATGRLDSASLSLELLFSETFEEAVPKATELKRLNDMRKEMTEKGIDAAFKLIEEENLYDNKVMVLFLPEVHESLVGIIAGRVKERFYKPTIVITRVEDGLKGSGRSIEAYNMHEELTKVAHLFTKFGGHKMAAGVSLKEENLAELISLLNKNCSLSEDDMQEKIKIDVPMPISYVSEKLIEEFAVLEPFGTGNPKPVFANRNVSIEGFFPMGSTGDMGKFRVTCEDGCKSELILFRGVQDFKDAINSKYGQDAWDRMLNKRLGADKILMDIIYYPSINEFRGVRSLQYIIQNYK